MMKLEIRLDRRLIDIEALLAQLLGVVAPVPGRELEVAALLLNERLHGVAVGESARPRRFPDAIEQPARGGGCLRHGVVEPVMREGLVAEQPRAFGAKPQHLRDDRLVVGLAAIVAARDPGAEDFFAQIPPRRELQEWLDARTAERDHMLAGHAA